MLEERCLMLVQVDLNIQRLVLQWPLTFLSDNRHISYRPTRSFYDILHELFSLSLTPWERLCMILTHYGTVEIIIIIILFFNCIVILLLLFLFFSAQGISDTEGEEKMVRKMSTLEWPLAQVVCSLKLLWSKIALNRWMATDNLWNRKALCLSSPGWTEILLYYYYYYYYWLWNYGSERTKQPIGSLNNDDVQTVKVGSRDLDFKGSPSASLLAKWPVLFQSMIYRRLMLMSNTQ